MFNIKQFLERFRSVREKEVVFRSAVQRVLREKVRVEVPSDAIHIRASIITLRGISPSARSEIFIKKQSIIDMLNSEQGIYRVKDMR